MLKPVSGHAGLGILECPAYQDRQPYQPVVRQIAEQFPGLDVHGLNHCHCLKRERAIKGVNWLTVLSDEHIERVGGFDYLRARLVESFVFYRYEGGLIIQAGARPQIGDATTNRWPWHYSVLAKVLKGIQVKDHRSFHSGRPGTFDMESAQRWLNRFDDVEIGPWPKAYKNQPPPDGSEPETQT